MFMIISHTKRYMGKKILYLKKKKSNIEHHLVLIVEITCPQANKQTNKQTTTRHTEKISRSDLTVRLKSSTIFARYFALFSICEETL